MTVFLVILAVVLFAVGVAYINENVHGTKGSIAYGFCLMIVTLCLLGMAARSL